MTVVDQRWGQRWPSCGPEHAPNVLFSPFRTLDDEWAKGWGELDCATCISNKVFGFRRYLRDRRLRDRRLTRRV